MIAKRTIKFTLYFQSLQQVYQECSKSFVGINLNRLDEFTKNSGSDQKLGQVSMRKLTTGP